MGRGRQGRDELFWQIKTSLNDLPHFCDDKLEAEKKNEKKHTKTTTTKNVNQTNKQKRKKTPKKQTKNALTVKRRKMRCRILICF